MKAGIYFTGSSPLLILTSYESLVDPRLIEKLQAKGIKKFIVYEASLDLVRQKYGNHYNVVMNDLKQEDDLRVLDYDGHHIYENFSLAQLRDPVVYEA